MFNFKKKRTSPLTKALSLIDEVQNIVYAYKHDHDYIPPAEDIKLFEMLEQNIGLNYCVIQYIVKCMHQRFEDKALCESGVAPPTPC